MSDFRIKPTTAYRPGHRIFDAHGHAFKNVPGFQTIVNAYTGLIGQNFEIYGSGSVDEAKQNMAKSGIGRRVIKNVARSASGVVKANDFAIETQTGYGERGLIATGAIHVEFSRNEEEIDKLAAAGVRGITLNSSWQGFAVNDPRLKTAYQEIARREMFVILHTGRDPLGTGPVTWPEQVLGLKEMVPELTVTAAHCGAILQVPFGQQQQWATEYKTIPGLLLDLAFILEHAYLNNISADRLLELFNMIGFDKIVYGSDFPWADPGRQLAIWENLLPAEAWPKVAYENAERELKLAC